MKKQLLTLLLIFVCIGTSLSQTFVHPGGLHSQEDLDRMKTKVAEGAHPWIDGWNKLIQDDLAQNTFRASPRSNMNLRQVMSRDAHAAYLNAIRWYISGDNSYADCAIRIFNDYSNTLNQIPSGGTTDIVGLGGIGIAEMAMAGEIMRLSDRWAESDFNRFKDMMVNYLYPVAHDFLTNHNGACITNYWTNWDANNIGALVAIGVLCDNQEIFDEGIEYYKNGAGTGRITHAVPYVHPSDQPYGLGQWQEAGRDQTHGFLGVGLMATICQIAWNQGMDLYGYDNNRLLAGAEYVAQYNLWKDVPFTTYNNCQPANNKWPSINGRGWFHDRPVYELLYNHYVVRQGLTAPNTQLMAELMRPESGSLDHFGYGTLTFTQEPSSVAVHPVPPAPASITAKPGVWKVDIEWEPSAGHAVRGYRLQRSTSASGPYETITEWDGKTTAKYTDWNAINGTTYYYRVAGKNQAGMGAYSVASNAATPQHTRELPLGWVTDRIGEGSAASASYADVNEGTYKLTTSGTDLVGTVDNFGYLYSKANGDVTITTRISQGDGAIKKGLMIRESLAENAKTVVMTLGDGGGRFAKMGFRNAEGASMSYLFGNAYTWYPAWFRIERIGDTFTAYESSDGIKWFTVGTRTISMDSQVYVGCVVVTGSQSNSTTITFDNVSVVSEGTTTPVAPENITVTEGNTQLSLSWDSVSNASGYNVKRATTSGGPYTIVASGLTETSYTDTGLENGTTYYYVVTAANFAGESQNSAEVSMAPVLTLAPVPAGVVASSVSATHIDLSWEASLSAETYNIKRSKTEGGPYTTIASPETTSFSDTTVDHTSTWYYVISAVNALGESDDSEEVSATPGRVGYWNFDETSGTTAVDSWGTANGTLKSGASWTSAIVNNGVQLDGSSEGYVSLGAIDMSGLDAITISTWVKFDEKPNGWARIFDLGSGTNLGNTMYLVPNTGDAGSGKNTIRFAIYSNGSTNSKLAYDYEWQLGEWTHIAVTQSGTTAKMYINGAYVAQTTFDRNPSNLGNTTNNRLGSSQRGTADPFLNGAIDEFKIFNRVLSDAEIFKMTEGLTLPATPTILSVSIETQQVALTWTEIPGATGYNVKRATKNGGPYTIIDSVTDTSYIDTSILADEVYYYVVSAINNQGESGDSKEESTAPDRVAYWNFDENTGSFAEDTWGTADGTLHSGANWTSGVANTAVQLDGTSNGYVTLGAIDMSDANEITMSTWVKFDETPKVWARIFDFGSGSNLSNTMYLVPNTGDAGNGKNTIRFAIYSNGSTNSKLAYNYEWQLGAWTHIAVTQSGNTAKMYINGAFVAQTTFDRNPSNLGNATNNNLGRSQRGTADPFLKGSIDEFKMYNRALSDVEIADMALAYLPPSAPKDLVTVVGNNQVSLGWTASQGATGYNVKRATDIEGPFELIANVTETGYTDATAVNCENYFYTVSAVNDNGESPNSSIAGLLSDSKLTGTLIGTDGSGGNNPATTKEAAVDGKLATYFDALVNTAWVGYDLGENGKSIITRVRYAPRPGFSQRMNGAQIQGANTPDFSDADILFVIPKPAEWVMTEQTISNSKGYRYVRYLSPNGYGSIAELEFYGLPAQLPEFSSDSTVEGTYGSEFHYSTVASNMPKEFEAAGLPDGLSIDTCTGVISGVPNAAGTFPVDITATNYYGSSTYAVELMIRKNQTIDFGSIPVKYIGDVDFELTAVASSGLPITYSSSDTTVATIVDGNKLHINAVGTSVITASQLGDSIYYPAEDVDQSFTVIPLNISVLHKSGENNVSNSLIMPHLQIVNEDNLGVAYNELTIRYWFTPENYAGINTWVDYAQLGKDKVSMNYVSLPEPHEGAFGYIEYGFDESLSNLLSGDNSGPIQSRFSNTNWSNFDETDDYSYQSNATYMNNEKVTLYRNGMLIWGTEPEAVTPNLDIKVYSENKNANISTNKIDTHLELTNEGNVPMDYKDLSIRYWFTKDSDADLIYWIDYAEFGMSNILGEFEGLNPVVSGADTYFELSVDSLSGSLYPLSNSGEIQFRISKTDWSKYDESNDFSYMPKAPFAENNHITVYYKGTLIYGIEPSGNNFAKGINDQKTANMNQLANIDQLEIEGLKVYPNPVSDKLTVLLNSENEDVQLMLHSSTGKLLIATKSRGNQHTLDLSTLSEGVYILTITDVNGSTFKKVVKE